MLDKNHIKIKQISLHRIGSKANLEGVELSDRPIVLEEDLAELLKCYFLLPFKKGDDYFEFCHPSALEQNEVYASVSAIFDAAPAAVPEGEPAGGEETEWQGLFHEQSRRLAKYLYEQSQYPNIKRGEFYVVYFQGCGLFSETVDAVGLFKSENKDTFIRVEQVAGQFSIESETGININRLDKGCLIFRTKREEGYVVSVIDNTNKGEAKYWVENFLCVRRKRDAGAQTQQFVSLCKDFVEQLPPEVDKVSKVCMMNRVMDGLKEQPVVDVQQLAGTAFGRELADGQFQAFKRDFERTHEVAFEPTFQSKPESVKRRAMGSMSVIRLDDHFDIHLHGGEHCIERGYDEARDMYYYKLFYRKEK